MMSAAVILVLSGGAGLAQMQQPAPKPATPRSAQSMECSRQADAKSLHGKARKHFRSKCMRDLRKQAV
jgi:hypothetical protein